MKKNETSGSTSRLMVVGYGNTLRRDDGVGVKVAEAVEALRLPGVEVITRHQLVPELAEAISKAKAVVFVDADIHGSGTPRLKTVEPAGAAQIMAHATNPGSLLSLAKDMFGGAPVAWTLGIPVQDMGFGDGLSGLAAHGLAAAVAEIKALAQRLPGAEQNT